MNVTIYHNSRCSKSRATLALLESQGVKPDIIEYLVTPPSTDELRNILALLGMKAIDLIRTKEQRFSEAKLDAPGVTEGDLLAAMVDNPILIERPIVLANGKARIGRPPESVLEIL